MRGGGGSSPKWSLNFHSWEDGHDAPATGLLMLRPQSGKESLLQMGKAPIHPLPTPFPLSQKTWVPPPTQPPTFHVVLGKSLFSWGPISLVIRKQIQLADLDDIQSSEVIGPLINSKHVYIPCPG